MNRARLVFAALLASAVLLAGCTQEEPPQQTNEPPALLVFPGAIQNLTVNLILYGQDPEGSSVRCEVDFGDGRTTELDCSNSVKIAHDYPNLGSYRVRVRAYDPAGNTTERTLTIDLPARGRPDCPAPRPPSGATIQGERKLQGWKELDASRVPGLLLVRPARNAPVPLAYGEALGSPQPGWLLVKTEPGREREAALALLSAGDVTFAQPVYRYRLLATPNDPYFREYQATTFAMMDLTEGWDWLSFRACRPKVAVVDTGVDLHHPDLTAHLLPGYDFNEGDTDPSDQNGHGSMVAGVVGAVTDNGEGVAGSSNNLAWVVPLKVFGSDTTTELTIAQAIDYAAQHDYHLINLSLCLLNAAGDACTDETDDYIEEALQRAYNAGLIAVAASGNYGDPFVGYPANSPYTIAVGSVATDGRRSNFSNYGKALDLVAPGENVLSTGNQGNYLQGDGTSFSTPFVTGILALYLGQHYAAKGSLPSFSQAVTCLANNTNQATWNAETGYGVPQADQVLDPADGTCYP